LIGQILYCENLNELRDLGRFFIHVYILLKYELRDLGRFFIHVYILLKYELRDLGRFFHWREIKQVKNILDVMLELDLTNKLKMPKSIYLNNKYIHVWRICLDLSIHTSIEYIHVWRIYRWNKMENKTIPVSKIKIVFIQ
jgi:hypothetical protein